MTLTRWAAALAAAAALLAPESAAAQHWTPGTALAVSGTALDCLRISDAGDALVWRRGTQLFANAPGGPAAVALGGPAHRCPSVTDSALAAQGADDRILLAAGDPLPSLGGILDANAGFGDSPQGALAAAGGTLAVGLEAQVGNRQIPELALGHAGAVALSGAVSFVEHSPVPGLDDAGRGIVVWGASEHLFARTFGPDGTLGAPQTLAPDVFGPVRLAVAPDGRAALAWTDLGHTTVLTGTTTAGLDLAGAVTTPVWGDVAVEPDGAAVAAGVADDDKSMEVVSRAAGAPFGAASRYPIGNGAWVEPPRLAILDGQAIAGFSEHPLEANPELDVVDTLAFAAGAPAGAPLRVPVASGEVKDFALAVQPPAVFTIVRRAREDFARPRYEVDAHALAAGPAPVPAGVRVQVPAKQVLGRPQALRLRLHCPGPCALRATADVEGGFFDTSVVFARAGTHRVRVPFAGDGFTIPERAVLAIGVDTPAGELRLRRSVRVYG